MKRQKAVTAALRTGEISREREREGPQNCTVSGGREMFSMSLQFHIVSRKCHSALGRQRSEASLICLTAFTEMFCGQIPRSLGGVPLHFVCPPTPLTLIVSHKTYNRPDLSATQFLFFLEKSFTWIHIHISMISSNHSGSIDMHQSICERSKVNCISKITSNKL